jgi:hypothetical protein
LQIRAQAELERRKRQQQIEVSIPDDWREWLTTFFPRLFSRGFADHHAEFWEWVESIRLGEKPKPFFAIWSRGGAKTTSAEAAVVRLGAKGARKFCLYVRATQDKANESVQNIAAMLEGAEISSCYPALASRQLGKYGHARGWRVDVLRCANGFSVVALGFDAAVRGIKIEEARPDLIVLDDIDAEKDTLRAVKKKIDILTKTILPAGSSDVAILGIQNLMHGNSIFTMITENRADFLYERTISGPHPAVVGLEYEQRAEGGYRITKGTATWEGQSLEICEAQINEWGLRAFLGEAQHNLESSGTIWNHVEFRRCDISEVPDIVFGAVWVDPAVTSTDESDAMGIQADGLGEDDKLYRFFSWEQIASPQEALEKAILKCLELGFSRVGVETDQGGETWQPTYNWVWEHMVKDEEKIGGAKCPYCGEWARTIRVNDDTRANEKTAAMIERVERAQAEEEAEEILAILVCSECEQCVDINALKPEYGWAKAGAGHGSKVARNQRMLVDYEQGKIIHVRGTHKVLERALKRFPEKPLDLADAARMSRLSASPTKKKRRGRSIGGGGWRGRMCRGCAQGGSRRLICRLVMWYNGRKGITNEKGRAR